MKESKKIFNVAELKVSYKTTEYKLNKITGSGSASEILKKFIFEPDELEYRESMFMLCLNRANEVLSYYQISAGGFSGTVCDPKVVFSVALGCGASSIILSHNHPSGQTQPSEADRVLTRKISEGAKLLDMKLLDHIIITESSHFSFSDEGLL